MECPVCKDLRRDHSRECEIEASMTLDYRAEAPNSTLGAKNGWGFLDPLLATRRRQVEIISRLDRHLAAEHAA